MTSIIIEEKLIDEINAAQGKRYYHELVKNEPDIDWFGFAKKLYRKRHSVTTIICYCRGLCVFRKFIGPKSIKQVLDELKANPSSVYQIFDDFSGWCDANGWRGSTAKLYTEGVKRLFYHLDVEIDDHKFRDRVTFTTVQSLDDFYPDNATIRKILTFAAPRIRTFIQVLCDTGLEPIDATQLRVKDLRFDEDPVRGTKRREKTGEKLEFFLSKETAESIKRIIANKNKQLDDYIFARRMSSSTSNTLRVQYNRTLARAGFGRLVKLKTTTYAKVEPLDGHPYGKYHLKVYKKRYFSMAMAAGIPEYIVQGMLGRKRYLDQYDRQPLSVKQQFARKILKIVDINAQSKTEQEKLVEAGEILGLCKLTSEQAAKLRDALGMFMTVPKSKLKELLAPDE